MKIETVLADLQEKNIISSEQSALIKTYEDEKPFSVHWELRSILFLGILFFSSGLGVIIYQNIDTIGHQAIIALIALLTVSCFVYAFRHRTPFTWEEVKSENKLNEYALLLGCTAFLILEGYIQFQYNLFESKYGLATAIPTILFFLCAYFFDHRGVLSMAITGLASCLGLTIAPLSLLSGNDFSDVRLLTVSISLGIGLILFSGVSLQRRFKAHFTFTYFLLGGHLAALASLVGLFEQDLKVVYFVFAIILSSFFIYYSRQKHALVFLLMGIVYGYIAFTYAFFRVLSYDGSFPIWIYYFMLSSIGIILFLFNVKKILGIKK